MKRKEIARQTLEIMEQGYYEAEGTKVEIGAGQAYSVENSILITPQEGQELLSGYGEEGDTARADEAEGKAGDAIQTPVRR